ncbi:MAG TPA: hypothetical protein VGQ83_13300, partial [Polyangia bacterium]
HDGGRFWRVSRVRLLAAHLAHPSSPLAGALLLGVALLGLALRRPGVYAAVFPPRPAGEARLLRVLPLLLVALAAALRLLDAPLTIANANGHAYGWLRSALVGVDTSPYGAGYPAFFRLLGVAGLPARAEAIMAANAVLGALSVAAVYALAMVVHRDRWAALAAAGLWAVLPAHVRLSASEDFPALLALSQLLAALGWALAGRHPGKTSLGAAVLLTFFAVQVRQEGWMIVVPCALLFAACAGRAGLALAARRIDCWIIVGLAAALAVAPVRQLVRALLSDRGAHHLVHPLSLETLAILVRRPGDVRLAAPILPRRPVLA